MGLCGYHHCSRGLGRMGGTHQTSCQTLGVQHRRGPACLGGLIGGLFPTPPSLFALVHSSLSSGMNPPQASATRWETGGQGVLCTHSRRGVRRSSGYPSQCQGHRPVLGVHFLCPSWVVLNGPCLPCNIVWLVYLRSWLSTSSFLSFRKCAVKFWTGTQKMRLLRGRPRSLSSSSPFSSSPWLVSTSAPFFARLFVAATCRRSGGVGSICVCSVIAQQVQSSAETAAAESNEQLAQQVVMGDSAQCSCLSCFSAGSRISPLDCPARFCSAACFATHQASCVAFAKPVMITFHKSPKGASIGGLLLNKVSRVL